MKKLAALVALSSVMASAALAGGPVVVAEEVTPVAVAPASSGSMGAGAVVAGLAGLALVAALVSDDDSN